MPAVLIEILANAITKVIFFVAVTFGLVEVLKWAIKQWFADEPRALAIIKKAQMIAFVLGIIIAVGWQQSLFPEPPQGPYQHYWVFAGYVLTGLLIGGGAVGAFEFLKEMRPRSNVDDSAGGA